MTYDPVLSLTTAGFELLVAGWALRGPGKKRIVRPASVILTLLAGYQLLEVLTCLGGMTSGPFPQLAFIDVTWLPPLGVLLAARLVSPLPRIGRWFTGTMFGGAFGFSIWIASHPGFASDPVCQLVFARYSHPAGAYLAYTVFYWVGLVGMVFLSAQGSLSGYNGHLRRLSRQLLIGALAFILPSLVTSWSGFLPTGAFASIMCHYALLLAVFLARLIYHERRASPVAYRLPAER